MAHVACGPSYDGLCGYLGHALNSRNQNAYATIGLRIATEKDKGNKITKKIYHKIIKEAVSIFCDDHEET